MKFPVCCLFAITLFLSSCCEEINPIWIIDPPQPCGPDVSYGLMPLTADTRAVLPDFNKNSRLVFVNAAGNERVFQMTTLLESTYHTNHVTLCSSAYGDQHGYYEAQSIQYLLRSGEGQDNPFINYVLRVEPYGEALYDGIEVQAHWDRQIYGQADFVTDDRGAALDDYVRGLRDNEQALAQVTLLGRSFQDVIFVSRPEDPAQGFYFQKGLGVVGFQLPGQVLWVLDRVE